jgi:outer membrane protein insertion porin family
MKKYPIINAVSLSKKWKKGFYLFVIAAFFLIGCSSTQYLKDGETFYDGAKIVFDTDGRRVGRKKILAREMKEYISVKPNAKFFGSRPSVWFYYSTGNPRKKKGLKNFLKEKVGKPPVLLSNVTPDRTAKTLEGYLYNEGYFKSKVAASVKTKKKESKVIYTVKLERPFRLRNIDYPKAKDSVYAHIIKALREKSLLKEKQRYQLGRLEAEQKRIEKELKDVGFYYFDDRYLLFVADSTVGKRKVDLELETEPDMPKRAKRIYKINDVTIYPEYTLSADSLATKGDTIKVNNFNYIERSHFFRPTVITDVINTRKGDLYSKEYQDLTVNHLMGLGAFKFVNIKFKPAYKDSALLNASIFLTPLKKKSLRAEVQGMSKSNNFVGPGLSFVFTNRNFLKGAELFQVKLNTAYEVQITRQNQNALNSFELGFETSLTVPRFITPVKIDFSLRRYLPKTQFKTGYNLQNRLGYFRLSSFNAGYGYNWRETAAKTHELFPVDITFIRTDKTSPQFDSLLSKNRVLANSFENQFIIGSRYSYTLNTQLMEMNLDRYEKRKVREHSFYFNGNIDIAGNLLNTVQSHVKRDHEGHFELFGAPYSQFVRTDIDFRYYWQPDANNKIATRMAFGIGYAYGNSSTLPYIKQFAIGGSNSIRAFPARSIGPGSYNVKTDPNIKENTLFVDQRADIKMESNVEYRFTIYSGLKGALFADAGNIWLRKYDSLRPGGQFHKDTFLKQLAIGSGVGLRYDLSFFVIRLDTAFPIRRNDVGWVLNDIDFGSRSWRRNNLIFNIAIGYPF